MTRRLLSCCSIGCLALAYGHGLLSAYFHQSGMHFYGSWAALAAFGFITVGVVLIVAVTAAP